MPALSPASPDAPDLASPADTTPSARRRGTLVGAAVAAVAVTAAVFGVTAALTGGTGDPQDTAASGAAFNQECSKLRWRIPPHVCLRTKFDRFDHLQIAKRGDIFWRLAAVKLDIAKSKLVGCFKDEIG